MVTFEKVRKNTQEDMHIPENTTEKNLASKVSRS